MGGARMAHPAGDGALAVASTETVLEVRDLRIEFPLRQGSLVAIDGVSFGIRKGESLAWSVSREPESR
jgi:hypothetical protein